MNKARLVVLSPRSVASARGVGRGRFLRRSRGHAADSGAVPGQGWVRRTRAAQISCNIEAMEKTRQNLTLVVEQDLLLAARKLHSISGPA